MCTEATVKVSPEEEKERLQWKDLQKRKLLSLE